MSKSVKPKLSIIILNFNSGAFLADCLKSISQSQLKHPIEIVIVDNASGDLSIKHSQKIIKKFPTKYLLLKKNLGFATGNNKGLAKTNKKSELVLFLNPDTIIKTNTLQKLINFFDRHPQADAATCKVVLALTKKIQPESHRGFPTPKNAFFHFFGLGLPKLFPKSKFFNGYFAGHLDLTKTHQIDACTGAFLAVRRRVGDSLGWWSQKYFFYGDDLDFCFRLKAKGYQLFFYPGCSVTHYQGISSGLISQSRKISTANRQTKLLAAKASTQAMRFFYQDHLLDHYSSLTQKIIMFAIDILEKHRIFKAKYL